MKNGKTIKQNYFFYLFKTVITVLIPVISFSYSSRVLRADGFGRIGFAKSIIVYFSMLSMLGMQYYGTREAAKRRENKLELEKFVHEMYTISLFMTALSYIALLIFLLCVPQMHMYFEICMILSTSIFLQTIGVEWLYQALEEYRYISIRSGLFQIIGLAATFLCVKSPDDLKKYSIIYVFGVYGAYILNYFRAYQYLKRRRDVNYEIKKHIKPLLMLFVMAISIQLYTVLDTTMLGFISGDASVGRYLAAERIIRLVNTLVTSLGVVLIPRLSFYIGTQQVKKINNLIEKSYNIVFMFSTPACLGLFMLSDEVIFLFTGNDFMPAAYTMKILAPIAIIIPFSIVTNTQTFVPMGKESAILVSTFSGAVVNLISNIFLISKYAENGAAVATVLAEFVVAGICFFNAKKYFNMRNIMKYYFQYWISAIPIIFIAGFLKRVLLLNCFVKIASIMILSAVCYFAILLLIFRNPYLTELLNSLKAKRVRGHHTNV